MLYWYVLYKNAANRAKSATDASFSERCHKILVAREGDILAHKVPAVRYRAGLIFDFVPGILANACGSHFFVGDD